VSAYLADPWFNSIAQNGDSDQCAIGVDDMAPVKAMAETGAGFLFTYPAGQYLRFIVSDARDPQAPPIDQVARRIPAISFVATIRCTYTSAPKLPYMLSIGVGNLRGTIE